MESIKINLDKRNWQRFCQFAFIQVLDRNKANKDKKKLFTFNYAYDEIEIMLVENVSEFDKPILNSITIDQTQYEAGNVSDIDFIQDCFKQLESSN